MSRAKKEHDIRFDKDLKPDKKENEKKGPPSVMQLKMDKDHGIFFGKGNFEDDINRGIRLSNHYMGKPQKINGHVIVLGSTGSGKGTCIAIPTMRSWANSSMVVLDVKGDLYEQWCKMDIPGKRKSKVFNPSKEDTYTYDPFNHIRSDDKTNWVSNIRELVNAMIPMPPNSRDKFWTTAARKILTGALHYYLDKGTDFFSAINEITDLSIVELFEKIDESQDAAAKKYIRAYIGKDGLKEDLDESEMLMDVNETLDTFLMEYVNDERIKRSLQYSDNAINWKDDLNPENKEAPNIFGVSRKRC